MTFTQTSPASNATYYVKAVDNDGKTINSATVNFVKTSLTTVTSLTLTKGTTTVNLKWLAGTSSEGISTYKIYRKLSTSSYTYLQGSTTSLAFSQTKPTVNATYYVKSVDKLGNTINSGTVSFVK